MMYDRLFGLGMTKHPESLEDFTEFIKSTKELFSHFEALVEFIENCGVNNNWEKFDLSLFKSIRKTLGEITNNEKAHFHLVISFFSQAKASGLPLENTISFSQSIYNEFEGTLISDDSLSLVLGCVMAGENEEKSTRDLFKHFSENFCKELEVLFDEDKRISLLSTMISHEFSTMIDMNDDELNLSSERIKRTLHPIQTLCTFARKTQLLEFDRNNELSVISGPGHQTKFERVSKYFKDKNKDPPSKFSKRPGPSKLVAYASSPDTGTTIEAYNTNVYTIRTEDNASAYEPQGKVIGPISNVTCVKIVPFFGKELILVFRKGRTIQYCFKGTQGKITVEYHVYSAEVIHSDVSDNTQSMVFICSVSGNKRIQFLSVSMPINVSINQDEAKIKFNFSSRFKDKISLSPTLSTYEEVMPPKHLLRNLKLIDLQKPICYCQLISEEKKIICVVPGDGIYVFSSQGECLVKLGAVTPALHSQEIPAIHNNLVFIGDSKGFIHVFDITQKTETFSLSPFYSYRAHCSKITCVSVSLCDNNLLVATASDDATIRIFSTDTEIPVEDLNERDKILRKHADELFEIDRECYLEESQYSNQYEEQSSIEEESSSGES